MGELKKFDIRVTYNNDSMKDLLRITTFLQEVQESHEKSIEKFNVILEGRASDNKDSLIRTVQELKQRISAFDNIPKKILSFLLPIITSIAVILITKYLGK